MPFRTMLRNDLAEARRANDGDLVSLIRALIAAIENAEAVDPLDGGGATEVPRRELSQGDIARIILDESDELREAAGEYERRGNEDEARRLRVLADVTDRYAQTLAPGR